MAAHALDPEVRRFIDRYIDSALDLELVLLVHQSAAPCSPAEVATSLRADRDHVQQRLERFSGLGLMRVDGTGKVSMGGGRTAVRALAGLARASETHRVAIVQAIFSKPSEGVRGFADAFKFRSDDEGEG